MCCAVLCRAVLCCSDEKLITARLSSDDRKHEPASKQGTTQTSRSRSRATNASHSNCQGAVMRDAAYGGLDTYVCFAVCMSVPSLCWLLCAVVSSASGAAAAAPAAAPAKAGPNPLVLVLLVLLLPIILIFFLVHNSHHACTHTYCITTRVTSGAHHASRATRHADTCDACPLCC